MMDDLDAVANAFYFAQQMGGKNDAVRIAQLTDERADVANLRRVEADRGFVENDDFRLVDDRLRDADALLVAFGKRADNFTAVILQAAAALGFGQVVGKLRARHAMQLGGKKQIIVHAHFTVQRRDFRQKADVRLGLCGLAREVVAAYFNVPRLRQQRAGEHLQRGALARAVVTEQAEHFAVPEFQRHVTDDFALAGTAAQVACRQG